MPLRKLCFAAFTRACAAGFGIYLLVILCFLLTSLLPWKDQRPLVVLMIVFPVGFLVAAKLADWIGRQLTIRRCSKRVIKFAEGSDRIAFFAEGDELVAITVLPRGDGIVIMKGIIDTTVMVLGKKSVTRLTSQEVWLADTPQAEDMPAIGQKQLSRQQKMSEEEFVQELKSLTSQ